jgi:ribokinase
VTVPFHAGPAPDAEGDVLVIGDVMVDVVTTHRDRIEPGLDAAARIRLGGGGSAANTACWLADLGARARLVAAVGDDALGDAAVAGLVDAGVEFAGHRIEGETTGTCVVLIGPDGERTMLPDRGANDRLPLAAAVQAFDPMPGWVHLSGYTLLGEGSRNAGRALLSAALAAGVRVSVDASSAAPLRAIGASAFLDWIEGVHVVFANDAEVEALGGVASVLERVSSVAVKHGSAGATWTDGGETVVVDGLPVDVVDPTAAGDAFAAGWIAARRAGEPVSVALAAAVAAGATAVTVPGARPPR